MINPDNITIVLKGTYYSGNIGSTARAMKNMGFTNLILVNPRCPLDDEAYSMARSASHIFEQAPVYNSLEEISKEFQLILGTSRRGAHRLHMRTSPRVMASELAKRYNHIKTAIVFGDEKAGLSNEDLALCAWYVRIPSNPDFESLNLSQSVMIICYELFLASIERSGELMKEEAAQKNINRLESHILQFLKKVGFPNRGDTQRVYSDIKRVISSADLKRTDVNLAHGFLRFLEENYLGGRLPEDDIEPDNIQEEKDAFLEGPDDKG